MTLSAGPVAAGWVAPAGPSDLPPLGPGRRVLSPFEFWPPSLFYLPVVLQWACLAVRYRSLTLPTLANPAMEAGGLCGESKTRMFAGLGVDARRWFAPFVSLRTSGDPGRDRAAAEAALAEAGLGLPLVAKPDIGCQGAGVQVIRGAHDLARYLQAFPQGETLLLQQLVAEPGEAGVFYVRRPGDASGRIFSMTLKYFPRVIGDGISTVEQLVRRDPRAGRISRIYLPRLAARLAEVPAAGEAVPLVFAGNHCKGAIFRDGAAYVTPAIVRRFDEIARAIPEFHFGRFDVRFASLAALQRGEGFRIIEVNGAGSEAIHIWDRDTGLWSAWRTLLRQFGLLFEIGHCNRARGYRPMKLRDLLDLYRRQQALLGRYPVTE